MHYSPPAEGHIQLACAAFLAAYGRSCGRTHLFGYTNERAQGFIYSLVRGERSGYFWRKQREVSARSISR